MKTTCRHLMLGLFGLLLFTGGRDAAAFETVTGTVVFVDDGDTVVLLTSAKTQMKIRLASIDAPESSHTKKETGRVGQPYSRNSGAYLETQVKGRNVVAHCFESDKYGRSVCELFVHDRSVNQSMVEQGWAWANLSNQGRYLRDKSLIALQGTAQTHRRGLWAAEKPIAPWVWRDVCWRQGSCLN